MKANPFVITFDDGADGGPEHVLGLLIGYNVQLLKEGALVFEGTVLATDIQRLPRFDTGTFVPTWHDEDVVVVRAFMPNGSDDGEVMTFPLYLDVFDEVRYL